MEKLWRVQCLLRRGDLSPAHRVTLMMVWDKSCAWGKPWAYLSLDWLAGACGVSRRKVVYVLKELEGLGVLRSRRTAGKNGYQVNYQEVESMGSLGVKGAAAVRSKAQGGVHDVHSGGAPGALHIEKNTKAEEQHRAAAPLRDLPARVIREKLSGFDGDHLDRQVTGGRLAATWKRAWEASPMQAHTMAQKLTPKEAGQLGRLKGRWPWERRELHFFVAWVVRDWQAVRGRLSWMRDGPPEQPHAGFVLGMAGPLMDMWAEKVRYDFARDLSNDRFLRLVAMGATEERAAEVAEPRPGPEPRAAPDAAADPVRWGTRPPRKWRRG